MKKLLVFLSLFGLFLGCTTQDKNSGETQKQSSKDAAKKDASKESSKKDVAKDTPKVNQEEIVLKVEGMS